MKIQNDMKRVILIWLLFSFSVTLSAQNEIKSKLVKVTVYPNSALVEKTVKVNLVKGDNKFVITNNATTFAKENLHFVQQKDFFITGVNLKSVSKSFNQSSKETFSSVVASQINNLNDRVQQIRMKIKDNNQLISIYNQQSNALKNIKAIKNTQSIDTVRILQEQFVFQREEGLRLNTMIAKVQKENEELGFVLEQDEGELESLVKRHNDNCNLTTKSQNIIVNIYSNRNMVVELQYNYVVTGVTSTYSYDVMLDEDIHNAIFNLKTDVMQRTNENWSNCDIVFSTSEAGIAGEDGELYTYYMNNQLPIYAHAPSKLQKVMITKNIVQTNGRSDERNLEYRTDEEEKEMDYDYDIQSATSSENFTLSKEYVLNTKQTIGSNDKPQTIPLVFDTTTVLFKHFTTPKNIEKVFYNALLPNWEDLGLQNVDCDIFLNGKYIATSYINTNSTKDTLSFSAGEDRGIKVARMVTKSSPDKGFLSSNVETTVVIKLDLKNTKSKEVDLIIKDQIPISQDANIKIVNVENNGGYLNSNTGIIKWSIKLKPKEVKELKFSYTVKYPKEYNLILN